MMKILTTGITSFMGKKITKLLNKNYEVLNIGRKNYENLPENIKNILFDDPELKNKLLNFKPDIFLNLASNSRGKSKTLNDLRLISDFNITISSYLIDIAISSKVKKIINISSNWSYLQGNSNPKFFNFYAYTKFALDKYISNACISSETKAISLVLFDNFDKYDPRNKIFNIIYNTIKNNENTNFSPGEQILNLTRMDDLAIAINSIINMEDWKFNGHKYYQITGQEISVKELALEMKKFLNNKNEIFNFGGLPYREGEIMKPQYFFDELPFLGERKLNIYESIKKELEK